MTSGHNYEYYPEDTGDTSQHYHGRLQEEYKAGEMRAHNSQGAVGASQMPQDYTHRSDQRPSQLNPVSRVQVHGWATDDGRSQVGSSEATLALVLEKLALQTELPTPPLMTFNGTPSEYTKFRRSFDLRVGTKPFTDSFKLSQLLMLTTGEAQKAIQNFDGTSDGYTQALAILNERFGRPYQIVKSCIEKITGGKRLTQHNRIARDCLNSRIS
jgi:hypothetical protein